mmetsp:Transcript_19949/g.32728  ORF Transcript_19949/g.32728 Transcript_19949/m.32728 type:complete len:357 (+) Transcript_19949:106-1176(+)|eukprot:CAMPEP_0184648778 /NCGR_PEP_ID=MMETSP0308-20130426/5991_1 /TAXON_ID=38269 /ORGANISM="Gloeochaete witrockiana, Strain SAG 46.84" /LENGTH=356 /DNA_ID=CAMNT_0027080935 /DNA_START=1 /DNA_END=1071 /DNA_ORIENTATION=+
MMRGSANADIPSSHPVSTDAVDPDSTANKQHSSASVLALEDIYAGDVQAVAGESCEINCALLPLDRVDALGLTPLHWGCIHGQVELVEAILKRKEVNTGSTDKEGNTPLHWAVREGHAAIAHLLLNHSAKVSVGNNDGLTALHVACMWKKDACVEVLLQHSQAARVVKYRDHSGYTPFMWAQRKGSSAICKMLEQAFPHLRSEFELPRNNSQPSMGGNQAHADLLAETERTKMLQERFAASEREIESLKARVAEAEKILKTERMQKRTEIIANDRRILELERSVRERLQSVSSRKSSSFKVSPPTSGEADYIQELHSVIDAFHDLLEVNTTSKNSEIDRLNKQVEDLEKRLLDGIR